MTETTDDAFLGGALSILQPRDGYRAGADPVFLAAAVPAKAGEFVLELGCGVGVAMACLCHRVPVHVTGLEREPNLADLAMGNLARNGLKGDVICADLTAPPQEVVQRSFDHVFANPPFFDRARGSASQGTREAGRGEQTMLSDWVDCATRRLKPGGSFTLIQRVERLPDVMSSLDARLGDVVVVPLAPRQGRDARLFLLQARKGARGEFRLAAPKVLHDGEAHERDGDSYSALARSVLRDGAALPV